MVPFSSAAAFSSLSFCSAVNSTALSLPKHRRGWPFGTLWALGFLLRSVFGERGGHEQQREGTS
jgi:hypothetical protein